MSMLGECLTALPVVYGADAVAACFQASATASAAESASKANLNLAHWTLGGGAFALAAAIVAFLALQSQVFKTARYNEALQRDAWRENLRRVATAFLADIQSLHAFFGAPNDVIATFRAKATENLRIDKLPRAHKDARKRDRVYFHPGETWLKYYQHDPRTVEVFDTDLAGELVSYHARMLNELGRMRWLHGLPAEDVNERSAAFLAEQQTTTANNLADLDNIQLNKLVPKLKEMAKPDSPT